MEKKGQQQRMGRVSPLQSVMLILLRQKPMYGYELLKALREEFEGVWSPQTGTIYPAVKRLEERGLVLVEKREGTDYYSLTEKGENELQEFVKQTPSDLGFMIRYFQILDRAAKEINGSSPLAGIEPLVIQGPGFSNMFEMDRMTPQEKLSLLKKAREKHLSKLAFMQTELEEIERKLHGKEKKEEKSKGEKK
jgi:DNA-binding PadR family transcriptional regulator